MQQLQLHACDFAMWSQMEKCFFDSPISRVTLTPWKFRHMFFQFQCFSWYSSWIPGSHGIYIPSLKFATYFNDLKWGFLLLGRLDKKTCGNHESYESLHVPKKCLPRWAPSRVIEKCYLHTGHTYTPLQFQ